MNIFVTNPFPAESAICLPDKHIVKMPLELLSNAFYCGIKNGIIITGTLPKSDGTPYATEKGAFRDHPCTKWI
jgi:hypothetical protein